MALLSKGTSNTKTAKNDILTYILYIAPHKQNVKGINLCPKATEGCAASCLYTAGLAGVYPKINQARIQKSNFYVTNRLGFLTQLAEEIKVAIRRAKGREILFRLNGTSDLGFLELLKKYGLFDYEQTPDNVMFYDYTKVEQRAYKYVNSKKYHLTFSRSGENDAEVLKMLELGGNVSVVFKGKFPETYLGYKVVDGDISDIEMIKHKGVVFGLKAKGEARKIKSSFVVDTTI